MFYILIKGFKKNKHLNHLIILLHVLEKLIVLFYKSCIVPECRIPLLENKTKFIFGQKGLALLMFNMFEGIKRYLF